MRIQPPPVTVDPPPLTVTPPPLTVAPPAMTVHPPSQTVQPPAVKVGRVSVTPPAITITPPAFTVQPPAVTVKPPALQVDPPPVTLTPPAFDVPDPPPRLVGSGTLRPGLAAFDKAVRDFMVAQKISAGTLAVARKGRLVLSRGYGWLDALHSEAVQPDTPMRFASVAKPLTRAAVRQLLGTTMANGSVFALGSAAFDILDVQPLNLPGHQRDSRLKDITIQHLLDHRGGWDSDKGPLLDPMFQTPLISAATGHQPASADDVVRFMVGQPLQNAPGAVMKYSNFGFCVLGRVIEKLSGRKYIDFLRDNVLVPSGISGIEAGRSLPWQRNPREPHYANTDPPVPNVVNPALPPCPLADGGFHLEAMDAHGGLIGSAADLVRFGSKFNFDGVPLMGDATDNRSHSGSLPGTTSLLQWRDDGVVMAVIFNIRRGKSQAQMGQFGQQIADALKQAADSITDWGP